ncbi:hypothetical protein WDV76_09085 [Xenorhabdus griffiniae]|uniref:hypothetical protein n=2 Tax=Morganellaceae TaxID=1903414 RepID=UPI0030CE69A0
MLARISNAARPKSNYRILDDKSLSEHFLSILYHHSAKIVGVISTEAVVYSEFSNREVNMPEHQIRTRITAPGLIRDLASKEERKARMLLGIVKLKRYHGLNNEELEQVMKIACELSK